MATSKLVGWAAAAAALVTLSACGKNFPIGEKLLPQSWGPPFGDEIARNQKPHPHSPASSERHAAADSEKSKTYASHQACLAALNAAARAHEETMLVTISSVEAVAHYQEGVEVHEHRCSDYILSHRSWCKYGAEESHGEEHKVGGRKLKVVCKREAGDHH
jgi:hypothetical protein